MELPDGPIRTGSLWILTRILLLQTLNSGSFRLFMIQLHKLVKVDLNLGAVKTSSIMELNLLSVSPAIVSRIVSNACLGVAWESMLLLTVCTRFCMKTIHLNILLPGSHVLNLFCLCQNILECVIKSIRTDRVKIHPSRLLTELRNMYFGLSF